MGSAVSRAEQALATLRDYVERTTHWEEGGADRHAALKVALPDLQEHIEWVNKDLAEWREAALSNRKQANAARATARIAIGHLDVVLNKCRSHEEQQRADTAARDWLASIGYEP